MPEDNIILPVSASMSKMTIQDSNKSQFGYNPSIGASSNEITPTTSSILLNKTVSLNPGVSKSINKKAFEVSLSSLSFLFCEIVNWSHKKSKGIQDLENRLNGLGYQIGQKFLELSKTREGLKYSKREIKIVEILQFIHSTLWKGLFGKIANELEKSQDVNNEYMIIDNCPLVSKFVNVPKDYGDLNCAAFIAGIIEGALDSAGFFADVTAHTMPKEGSPLRTVFLIKFDDSVISKEEQTVQS
ncbi:TRAPP I complex [Yamadazyma tenuis ATCC 10573]|uniref:Trafficking protein particle complex subunit n=1 Tax=Candida tenuis (strain ATCC 10573 / BCRC 21748 / CBS 615 / JCM 9827 / NBRC 10315 / NRRL Y-1498 / VKM Y-70) TaxID=590646 RepID=G3AXG1_CANTC|nr:TRAPP I complex [Yamadazyma tenuis ATCC 10573]EGV66369.1 TRAPP I complex [Yamadazyma tenuis ATCC 10573]